MLNYINYPLKCKTFSHVIEGQGDGSAAKALTLQVLQPELNPQYLHTWWNQLLQAAFCEAHAHVWHTPEMKS